MLYSCTHMATVGVKGLNFPFCSPSALHILSLYIACGPSLPPIGPPRTSTAVEAHDSVSLLRPTLVFLSVLSYHLFTVNGEPVFGVTSLAGEVFVLRWKERDEVEVYDVITFRLQRCLTVPNACSFADMTSCEHYHCLYIGDPDVECVHRLEVDGTATQWPVNEEPFGLSVNVAHNVLVTCDVVGKIKEFSSHGDLLRELTLPDDVINPLHTIQSRSGQFIVCHGYGDDPLDRVCMISADGRHIVHSHGGLQGSDIGQYRSPRHLAVDNDNECVYVVDVNNRRVTLLSPTLNYMREAVSSDKLKWLPSRLYLDVQRRRLYVTDNEWKDGKYTAGRVVVFDVYQS